MEAGVVDKGWTYLEKQYFKDPGDMANTVRYLTALKAENREDVFEKEIKKTIELFPDNVKLLYFLAEHYEDNLEYEKAFGCWETILEKDSKNGDIFNKCVIFLNYSKKYDELAGLYERYLLKNGSDPDKLRQLLDVYSALRDPVNTAKTCKRILEIVPGDRAARTCLAQAYEYGGEDALALDIYEEMALEETAGKDSRGVYINKLIALGGYDRLIRAIEEHQFNDAVQIIISDALLSRYETSGQEKEKIQVVMERALEADQTNIHLKKSLGIIYFDKKEYRKAKTMLEEYTAVNKGDATVNILLGETLMVLGEAEKSREQYEEALTAMKEEDEEPLEEQDPFAKKVDEFWLLWNLDKKKEAIRLAEPLLDNVKIPAEIIEVMFYSYVERGELRKAEKMVEKINKLDPRKAIPLTRDLGEAYFNDREYKKALMILKEYNDKTGGDHRSYHILGDILAAKGDRSGSRREYTRALELIRRSY